MDPKHAAWIRSTRIRGKQMHLQLCFQAVAIMDKVIHHCWLHNQSSIIKMLSAKSFIIRVNDVCLKFWRLQCSGGPKKLGIIALQRRCCSITYTSISFLLTLAFQSLVFLKQTFCYTYGIANFEIYTYAQVAAPMKFSNKLLPEKQSKGSLDSCKCTSHGRIHSPVFNKMQASAEAFSVLGALSRSLPWISGASWGLLWSLSLSLITACAYIYTQSDTVSLCFPGNEAKHAKNYFLSPHSPNPCGYTMTSPSPHYLSPIHHPHPSCLPISPAIWNICPKGWGCAQSAVMKSVIALSALCFRLQFKKPSCLARGLRDGTIVCPTED